MLILFPLISRIFSSEYELISSPLKIILPFEIYPGLLIRFIIENPVTDLPAPLSPTNPSVSPLSKVKSIPSMAIISPVLRANLTSRS